MEGESGVHFLNLSYFFRILYDTVFGTGGVDGSISGFLVFLSQLWVIVTILAVLISLFAIFLLVYSTTRIFQIRQEEAPTYATITQHDEHGKVGERVLLSPDQVEAVIRFYRQWHPAKRAARV